MPGRLTIDDVRVSLNAHAAAKGDEIRRKYGPRIGWPEMQRILEDREQVRYPCEIAFDAGPLREGELAHPEPRGSRPEDGFVIHLHPVLMTCMDQLPLLVLYQLVVVNYGEFAGAEAAEQFGSHAFGLHPDEYYARLCRLADLRRP